MINLAFKTSNVDYLDTRASKDTQNHTFLGGSTSTQSRPGVVGEITVEAVVNGVVLGGNVGTHGLKFTST